MRFGLVILPQYEWPEAGGSGAMPSGSASTTPGPTTTCRGAASRASGGTPPSRPHGRGDGRPERIRLGTFVASPNYRHPVPFAKDVATLDQVSGGRVVLGLGSGGTGFDRTCSARASSPRAKRYERFREFTEALDVLLRFERGSGRGISYSGEWFSAAGARMVGEPPGAPTPFPHRRERAALDAARRPPRSGWVTTGPKADTDDRVVVGRRRPRRTARRGACAAEGRDPGDLDRVLSLDDDERYSMTSVDAFEEAVGRRAANLGFTDVVAHRPREHGLYAGQRGRARGDRLAARRTALSGASRAAR